MLTATERKNYAHELAADYLEKRKERCLVNNDKLTPQREKQIINLVARTGLSNDEAACACGITKMTFQNWQRWGRLEAERIQTETQKAVNKLIEQGKINPNDIDELDSFVSDYIKILKPSKFFTFFTKLESAKAKVLAEQLENIKRAGKGGKYLTEKIVHKDKDGKVKRTETKSRYSVPQWGASAWILERLRPDIYSETKKVQSTMDIQGQVDHNVKIDLESSKAAQMLEILLNSDYMALSDNTANDTVDGEIVE